MKMLAGNALLAVILVGWYFYIQGDTNWGLGGGAANPHVQALRNSDDWSSSEKTVDEHVRALQHVGDNNWMVAGAVMAFVSFLSGITMGYWLRGPGKSRRAGQRPESDPAATHLSAAIPVAQAASADPVAAIPPVDEAEPIEPDIPGPDDLDEPELEESKPSIVVHSILVVTANPPEAEQSPAHVPVVEENESHPAHAPAAPQP